MNRKFIEISRLISGNYRYGSAYLQKAMKKINLGPAQHAYMLVIRDTPGASQEFLSSHFMVDKANVARVVSSLIMKGYVVKQRSYDDRRSCKLFITRQGLAIIPDIETILTDWAGSTLAGVASDEINATIKVLSAMFEKSTKLVSQK